MSDRLDLAGLVAAAAPEELPALIGELEAAKAVAWVRLAVPPKAEPPVEDRNLSADEAARRLGVSRDWLYRNARQLHAMNVGRRVVFSSRALERWLRSRER